MAESHLTLVYAEATKVLGEYTHTISFPADQDFLIVYGPNGVGKTKFLEIIDGLARVDGTALQRLPFDTASVRFSDGTSLSVEGIDTPLVASNGKWIMRRLRFTLHRPGRKLEVWDFSEDEFEEWLEKQTLWRRWDESGIWEDRSDGELVHIAELRDRYGDIAAGARTARDRARRATSIPDSYRKMRQLSRTYLIETQRLRIEAAASRRPASSPGRPQRPRDRIDSKIVQHARKMQALISEAEAEHSRITQQRDRDFPFRVLSGGTALPDADGVRRRYEQQNDFRSRLGRVASVDLAEETQLPDREFNDTELRLVNLYLDDAEQKLAPFGKLLRKIELLEDVVNSRLLRKRLEISANDGLAVRHLPEDRLIDLDSLSSGEQHEIILMFDLLFNVPEGALVMIDEPEISLHVVWQLAFIPDVQRIAELANFRFIVATHSPQIINDAWEQAFPLGPEEEPFV